MSRVPSRSALRERLPGTVEATLALLAGLAAVAGSYALAGYTQSFVVAPIDQQVVFLTPGQIVTYMIENVGEEAHYLHIGLSVMIATGLFALLALGGMWLAERVDKRRGDGNPLDGMLAGGAVAGSIGWVLTWLLTGEPALSLGAAIPLAVFTAAGHLQGSTTEPDASRRRALGTIAGAVGFVGMAGILGRLLSESEQLEEAPETENVPTRIQEAEAQSLETANSDLTGLVSAIGDFYNVDIATFDPEISADEWEVTVTGDVEQELTVTYDELLSRESEDRFVTLRCVGERLNGKKLDTALWTGTPIQPLLEEVDPDGNCDCVMLHGDDDYFVQYPVEVLESGFLAWGMNGKQLPQAHGHPVRVLIPGHWGETNVKWLTEIEVLEMEDDGYWERRGWEGTGEVKTVAKLWKEGISTLDDGRIELAGHAYAGTRGIDRVEVSVDGGSTWTDAELSEPLPDEDVWRMWRYTFDPSGEHEVVVRATDGEGNLQIEEESDSAPDGASGWVSRTVEA